MLYEQIDPGLRRHLSAEAKVDLKIASVTLRQAERSPAARIAKLRMVEQYIDASHHVGTISSPGQEYFRGSMAMRWAGSQATAPAAPPADGTQCSSRDRMNGT
jgi:hypothetical protein